VATFFLAAADKPVSPNSCGERQMANSELKRVKTVPAIADIIIRSIPEEFEPSAAFATLARAMALLINRTYTTKQERKQAAAVMAEAIFIAVEAFSQAETLQ
jgi:hypothetical protein